MLILPHSSVRARATPAIAIAIACVATALVPAGLRAQAPDPSGARNPSAGGCELKEVIFASGPESAQSVTSKVPAHVGDAVSVFYFCPLEEPQADPRFPRGGRSTYPVSTAVTVGGAPAQILNSGVAPFENLRRLSFVIPVPLTGTSLPSTTVWQSSLEVESEDRNDSLGLLLIVYEPNGSYLGNPAAPVTVVEYGDYQCPFCGSFFENTWPQLKSEYVDTGEVRFLFQDMAFLGPDSTTAAEAVHCAGDQYRFWEYHDYLYAHQGVENSGWATASNLKQFAAGMGLDTAPFNSCLDSGKYLQEVKSETASGTAQKITGTPGFLINGTLLVGAQPVSSFQQAINAALAATKE